jgi:CIC family chloride channel protein
MPRVPAEAKAAIVGAAVGLLGIAAPSLVGEGEALNEGVLLGRYAIPGLVVILLVRWLLSPASYALGTPGGLFAPLLVIGATIGALFAETANLMGVHLSVLAFGIVGMSAMFTAVVRAPLTGIVLIMEMTATTTLFVPLALAAACAMIVTTLLSSEPVYAALRQRMTERP